MKGGQPKESNSDIDMFGHYHTALTLLVHVRDFYGRLPDKRRHICPPRRGSIFASLLSPITFFGHIFLLLSPGLEPAPPAILRTRSMFLHLKRGDYPVSWSTRLSNFAVHTTDPCFCILENCEYDVIQQPSIACKDERFRPQKSHRAHGVCPDPLTLKYPASVVLGKGLSVWSRAPCFDGAEPRIIR